MLWRPSNLNPDMQAFQEVVYACLAKNPAERPTAAQLLQMRFFKVGASPESDCSLHPNVCWQTGSYLHVICSAACAADYTKRPRSQRASQLLSLKHSCP